MSSPWDDVRQDSIEMPAMQQRASPLPWMLLAVAIALTVGVLFIGKIRLDEERARYAAALKANDDEHAKYRSAVSEQERIKLDLAERDNAQAELSKQIVTLQLQIQRLHDELTKAKAKK